MASRLKTASLLATALVAILPMASAEDQQPVLTIPFFPYDASGSDIGYDASVIAADGTTTELYIWCADDSDGCGMFPTNTLTIGPSTYNWYMSDEGYKGTQDCSRAGTTRAVCKESAGGDEANFPGSSSETYEGTDIGYVKVTVTAGAEKLQATPAPASVSALPTLTGVSSLTLLSGSPMSTVEALGSSAPSSSSSSGSQAAAMPTTGAAVLGSRVQGLGLAAVAAGAMGVLAL